MIKTSEVVKIEIELLAAAALSKVCLPLDNKLCCLGLNNNDVSLEALLHFQELQESVNANYKMYCCESRVSTDVLKNIKGLKVFH